MLERSFGLGSEKNSECESLQSLSLFEGQGG